MKLLLLSIVAVICAALVIPDQSTVESLPENYNYLDKQSSQIVLGKVSKNQDEDADSDLWGTMPATSENNLDSSSDRSIEHYLRDEESELDSSATRDGFFVQYWVEDDDDWDDDNLDCGHHPHHHHPHCHRPPRKHHDCPCHGGHRRGNHGDGAEDGDDGCSPPGGDGCPGDGEGGNDGGDSDSPPHGCPGHGGGRHGRGGHHRGGHHGGDDNDDHGDSACKCHRYPRPCPSPKRSGRPRRRPCSHNDSADE